MIRLIEVTALVVCLLLLPVSASVLIGRQQPVPPVLTLLRLTDCAPPCWIGIMPGKATLDETRDRIHAVYDGRPDVSLTFEPGSSPTTFRVRLGRRDNALGAVEIRLDTGGDPSIGMIAFDFTSVDRRNLVTLADMYALWGAPPEMGLLNLGANNPFDLALIYGNEEQGAIVFAPPARSAPWTLDASVLVFYVDHVMPLAPSVAVQPWPGFSQLTYWGR
jgi:hypothetical protein